uniref:NADH-ubiquinone oxidoreductase chain 2 n=1 Tax=Brachycybe lecontii TaxID=1176341 RepID=S4T036_BRALC|nr:NADH dehydrogenase subunit 2 [Brachycybe lecontii]AFR77036.1 NADH dehydrogenase subunit 2 [Brachycybe lecontii]
MTNLSYKFMFLLFLMLGTLITISANSWFMAWLGLEINMMSFIPLLTHFSTLSAESTLKYFLMQTISSIVLLSSCTMILLLSSMQMLNNYFPLKILIECSMLMKLGAAPFHLWVIHIINGMSWINTIILLTWQKIAPLSLLFTMKNSYFVWMISMLSAMIGAIGGLNQLSLKKLMAFSSISHMGWMLCSLMISKSLLYFYFISYSLISTSIILILNIMSMYHLNQIFTFFKNKTIYKMMYSIMMFSYSGLPPLLGFIQKWLILNSLMLNSNLLISLILIFSSLITMIFYIRMTYSMILLSFFMVKWYHVMSFKLPLNISILLIFSISLSPIIIFLPF